MAVILNSFISISLFLAGYKLVKTMDQEFATASLQHKKAAAGAILYLILSALVKQQESIEKNILISFFLGSLVLAAYCDQCTTDVYDILYVPGIASGIALMILNRDILTRQTVFELIYFMLIQFLLFGRMYGLSDSIAFSMCAIWQTGTGGSLLEYVLLMSAAFILLTIVQGVKRNINRKGNLKKQVAFIPYIAAAMFFF